MLTDLYTMIWKETAELLAQYRSKSYIPLLALVGVLAAFATVIVYMEGSETMDSMMVVWWVIPSFIVSQMIADSFAGERERHTLETLLASRLPDGVILWAKVLTPVFFSNVLVSVGIFASLIPINLIVREGNGLLLYSPETVFNGILTGVLITLLISTGGVYISLNASGVQAAQSRIGILLMLITALPTLLPITLILIAPGIFLPLLRYMQAELSIGEAILLVDALLLIFISGLYVLARRRFRRHHLMLI